MGHTEQTESDRLRKLTLGVLDRHGRDKGDLIAILQAVHSEAGYLSEDSIRVLARELRVSEHDVFGTASFYAQFKFTKPGRHIIRVCAGTACFVGGGDVILEAAKSKLGILPGETTEDGAFSLERVACLGCCALAPVMTVDDEVHGKTSPAKFARVVDKIRKADSNGGDDG